LSTHWLSFGTNCGNKNAADINICMQLGKSPSSLTKAKGFELFWVSVLPGSTQWDIRRIQPKLTPTKKIGKLFFASCDPTRIGYTPTHSNKGGLPIDVQLRCSGKKNIEQKYPS